MKAFLVAVLIFAICSVAMAQDQMAEKKAILKACREENKATEQEVDDAHSGKTPPEKISQAIKCTMKCMMEKNGAMDPATGEFKANVMKEKFASKPKMADAVDKCKGQKGANPCDTAYLITTCIFKNS